MAIANITIFVRRAWLMAFVAGVALFAHTLGFLRFGVHEACTFPRADIPLAEAWACDTAVFPEKAFFAFAHGLALAAVFDTLPTLLATTDPTEGIFPALHRTIATLEPCLTNAFPTARTTRHTLPLAKADAALAVFRACDLALVPQISFGTLAKCHLLHLVIQAFAMPVAHFTLRGTRAFSIACFAFPGSHAFTLGLAQLVHTAFAVLAAHLLAKSLGASLCTILAHTAELAPARSFLLLLVKQARASARTAHLAPIQKARALHHALGPSTTACTGALLRLHWTLACAEKFRVLLVEGGIFAKGIKAGATTAPLVGVVADVQVISIVAHEKLGLAQRLE